jgi:aspartyl-tRNA(Asn)/glutamyl-tRNA(Gln) amidotransferase subunit A
VALAQLTPAGIWITELAPGPAGRRLAVKDLFATAGVRTTYGSAVFADHVPAVTAPAVAQLEAAGWVDVGKANLHEFAYGTTSQNLHYGTVPNPVVPGRTAGGSSGGSAAALAAGLADGALGTDTGGSIRIPAACCEIVGFKPSYGLVSIDGVFPLAPSFDHAGPMARDVETCIDLMEVLAPSLDLAPRRALEDVSVAVAWTREADDDVRACVEATARHFPRRRELDLPTAEPIGTAFMREVGDVHRDLYAESGELYGDNIRGKVERCIAVSDTEYREASQARERYRTLVDELLGDADLLVTPTLAMGPPAAGIDEPAERGRFVRFTFPFNALGWPALALPCGRTPAGLPASIQLVGRAGDDALVLGVGLALERAIKH